jgi:outer membrane lipoprotein LolB
MHRRRLTLAAGLALLAQACALAPPTTPALPDQPVWTGRLALRIDNDPPERLAAGFELRGRPEAGQLMLEGALGQTLLHLSWSATGAVARTPGGESRHARLDDALGAFTSTPLPVAALFEWLQGRPAPVPGWQTELDRLPEGRLLARRIAPEPQLELRLLLEAAPGSDNARR